MGPPTGVWLGLPGATPLKKGHQLSIASQEWGLMISFPLHARMLTVNWRGLVWFFLFLSAFHVDMSKYTLLWFIYQVHQAPCLAIVIKKVEKNTKQTTKPYVQRFVLIMIETNKQMYIKIFNTLIALLIRMEGKYCSICLGKSHERSCSEKASFQANLNNGKTRTWRFTGRQSSSLSTYLQWVVTGTHGVEASYS